MSRMVCCGKQLEELTDYELLVWRRDIEMAREAVVASRGEDLAARLYDEDLEELAGEIARRPGLIEQPALARLEPNPFAGKLRLDYGEPPLPAGHTDESILAWDRICFLPNLNLAEGQAFKARADWLKRK